MHSLAAALHDLADKAEGFGADPEAVEGVRSVAGRFDSACRALGLREARPLPGVSTRERRRSSGRDGYNLRATSTIESLG